MVVLWAVPVVVALFVVRRAVQARRTRRQTVAALGLVSELAGTVPPGTADRAAAWAARLAEHTGHDPERVATAARLHDVDLEVLTESGIPTQTAQVVQEAANAPRGQALGEAAIVRVAHGYARRLGDEGSQPSGALFRTLVDHAAGDERRVAQVLVTIVQSGLRPA